MNAIKLATLALLTSVGCGGVSGDGDDSDPGTGAGFEPHPAWLSGRSYTKGYKVENNIAFESEDKGISFEGAPDYKYKLKVGKSWSDGGTWKLDGKKLVLSGGETIDLATKMFASCRIIDLAAGRMFAEPLEAGAAACPFAIKASGAACNKVGIYSHNESTSGSSSTWSSTSIVLDPDGFYERNSGHGSSVCYGTTCKSLANNAPPTVGEWQLVGTTLKDKNGTAIDVSGMEFDSAAESCGGMAPSPEPEPGPQQPVCGNGTCESGETSSSCSADCSTPPAAPSMKVQNNASRTIYSLYAARCSDTTWGTNKLSNPIQPGNWAGWTTFPTGCWDFRAVDADGTHKWSTYNNQINAGNNYTWTLTDANVDPAQ